MKDQVKGIIQILRNRGWIRNSYHTNKGVCLTGAVAIFEGHSLTSNCKQYHGKGHSCITQTENQSSLRYWMMKEIGGLISYNDNHFTLEGLENHLKRDFEI